MFVQEEMWVCSELLYQAYHIIRLLIILFSTIFSSTNTIKLGDIIDVNNLLLWHNCSPCYFVAE